MVSTANLKKIEKTTANINRGISLALLIILFVLGICGITKIITGKASFFGLRPIFVVTESMEPTIHAKSFVLSKAVTAEDVEIGDIIAYRQSMAIGSRLIVHRCIEIQEDGILVMKGDNNEHADDPVAPDQVMYRVFWY